MNWLDIAIASLLLISTLAAARKGFSREIIGLAAALLGLVLGMQFYRLAGEPLRPYFGGETLTSVGGFLLVFFGVIVCGAIISSLVRRILKAAGLSLLDRLLGAAYGLLRGGLVAVVVIFAMGTFLSPEAVVQSRMAPVLIEMSHVAVNTAPREWRDQIQRQYDAVKSSSRTVVTNQ